MQKVITSERVPIMLWLYGILYQGMSRFNEGLFPGSQLLYQFRVK